MYLTAVTSQWTNVCACGPKARAVLEGAGAGARLAPAAFPFMAMRGMTVAGYPGAGREGRLHRRARLRDQRVGETVGYQAEVSGPERPALISLRIGAEGLPAVERVLGVTAPRPAGFVSRNGSVTMFGPGPDEWLIRTGPDEEEDWLAKLEAATAASFSAVVLVSDAYRIFTIAGPDTLDVLTQATGVDIHPSVFPTGRAVRTAFAKVGALIHRLDDRPSFDIYVDAAVSRYAGRWIESAIGAGPATSSNMRQAARRLQPHAH